MTLHIDAKFKEKLTCSFKYDLRNYVNFQSITEMSKKFPFDELSLSKVIRFELRNYRGVIFHDTKQ